MILSYITAHTFYKSISKFERPVNLILKKYSKISNCCKLLATVLKPGSKICEILTNRKE
jgi:hypothetical protein